jgi:hypothetical protein
LETTACDNAAGLHSIRFVPAMQTNTQAVDIFDLLLALLGVAGFLTLIGSLIALFIF